MSLCEKQYIISQKKKKRLEIPGRLVDMCAGCHTFSDTVGDEARQLLHTKNKKVR
jgi:hypothetical protein